MSPNPTENELVEHVESSVARELRFYKDLESLGNNVAQKSKPSLR